MFRLRAYLINAYLASFDLAITVSCFLSLSGFQLTAPWPNILRTSLPAGHLFGLGAAVLVWLSLSLYFGLYHSRRLDSPFADAITLCKVGFASWVVLGGLAHEFPALAQARFFTLRFAILNTIALSAARSALRMVLRELRRRGWNVKSLVLVSTPELGRRLAEKFEQHSAYGYRIVAQFLYSQDEGLSLMEKLRECLRLCRVDDVILALPAQANGLAAQLILVCESQGVNVRIVPDLFPLVQTETQVYDLGGIPLINVRLYPTEYFRYAVLKRTFDIAVSSAVLTILSPLYLVIATLIKLSSRGPVLFAQERVGLNGRKFKMLKFRTMREGPELKSDSHWTVPNDPNVTALGRWLRRTNLDELPQFLNVLMGHMSVVGPRPERPFFLDRFRGQIPEYMARHYVKSGITGWAQVNGWRGDTSIPQRVAHDLYYIRNWAMRLDLKILFLTLTRTFFHRNAY